jgi:hypothetical protein
MESRPRKLIIKARLLPTSLLCLRCGHLFKKLLTLADYNLVTKVYSVGSPIKLMGEFLATSMCRPHNCGDGRAGLAINLNTGDMYVRMQQVSKERWIVSAGKKESDLPKEVRDYVGDPAKQ